MLRCNMDRIIQDALPERNPFLLHCNNLETAF